tara:strand:+ start:613 stop:2238 length:1626 start_codon:yes stop_codon:yes gene_type:complete
MATIQSTKPGEIAGSSVLTGRTPSYRLVLKVDPQTGQYKYEYEVDEAPKAVDTVVAPVAASAAVADPAKKTEEKKTDTTDPKTSFEQTKAALSGAQLRKARGSGPEDRGTFQERFGTAEDRGFGFSGGTGTFRDPKFGRTGDTFTPAPGLGFAFDEFGRKRNIGVMNDLGLNLADTAGKVAKPVQDFVAGGGILGAAKRVADSITGKKEEDTKPTTTGFDPDKQQQRTTFDQTAQALGGTANLGSTRGFFSDLEPARKDIDQQIAELEERAKSPTSPRTFIANEIERLKEQKEKLDPTGQIKLPSDRQPGLDTTTKTKTRTVDRPNMRDIAGDQLSRVNANYGTAKTGTQKREIENSKEVKDIRDKVAKQDAQLGRQVDRGNAISNKARKNEVSDKNGNAVTSKKTGKAINFGRKKKEKEGRGGQNKGRIICSELYKQNLISKEDYMLDLYYTSKHLTDQHTAGYWHFAVPAVKAMRRSKFWTAFWKEIAYNRLQDIKWRLGKGNFNLRGRIYSSIFEPFCYISGYFTPNSNYNELYEGEV